MKDLFGQALLDFHQKTMGVPLLLHTEYGPPETIPLERFFAGEDEFPDLDIFALEQVHGKILDIGAATGRHAFYLQSQGHDITAMDISGSCGIVMKEIGVEKIIIKDIFNFEGQIFDTIFMLMNGIGIAGTIEGLKKLLRHIKCVLKPTGQLLFDSSDISYLYEDRPLPENAYFGELSYRYQYKNKFGDPFNWLFIDREKLVDIANSVGWSCQIIYEDETGAYLARLQKR
ncbi:MAG: class I SAM-dependent methyltransferase [Cyclobacteriaceae bacterium]|nr:class I SAM-dependent methyltransferase [Cyclobacteriaceae bacterium]